MLQQHNNIIIVSIRRSGGKLLRNLLDGHPSIKALPFEQWQTAKKARYPGKSLARYAELTPAERLSICGFYRHTAAKISKFHGEAARDEFIRALEAQAADCASSPDLYERFVSTYFTRFHGVPEMGGTRIVNHCGNLALLPPQELDQIFGPSIKIVLWRDPRAAYVSSRALALRLRSRVFDASDLKQFCQHYRTAFLHYCSWRGPQLMFEDLVLDPASSIRALAASIDLEFDDALLVPTIMGEPRRANSSFQRAFGAIDANAAAQWREQISPGERDGIERELGDIISRLGYADVERDLA